MWTLYIIFAIIGGPITLFLHEFTHAIIVWIFGGKVLAFKMLPYKTEYGWRLAGIEHRTYIGAHDIAKALVFQCWFYSIPALKALVLLILWILLGCFVHYSFFILAFYELIDEANWWRGFFQILWSNPLFDGARFRRFF